MIDLHTHSSYSDGVLSPKKLVAEAKKAGVTVLALTDHDTIEGLVEFLEACATVSIQAIPGIEVSCTLGTHDVHILGYGIRHTDENLQTYCTAKKSFNHQRVRRIITLLADQGIELDGEAILADAGDNPKRVHIIRAIHQQPALLKKILGTFAIPDDINTLFRTLVGRNGIAYVPGKVTTPREAIQLITASGGIAVLAHPALYVSMTDKDIMTLIEAGLQGIECYYPEFTLEETTRFLAIAKQFNLIVTGGTDFHGGGVHPEISLGVGKGNFSIPSAVGQTLLRALTP